MTIDKIFDLLDDWRNLPSYQLERRADIFFAIHLDQIIQSCLGIAIDVIIPEFPIRSGDIKKKEKGNNLSFKIDYVAISKQEQKVYLIELKTDIRSKRIEQDDYLVEASQRTVSELINGLLHIYEASNQKKKYKNLLFKLQELGWLQLDKGKIINSNIQIKPQVIYIVPNSDENKDSIITFEKIIRKLNNSSDPLTIRFLQSLERWKINPNDKK